MKNNSLGKGLDELFSGSGLDDLDSGVTELEIALIRPDENQHRKTFINESLEELAQSIRLHGIIQPITVRPMGKEYKIIAGERRYRAARLAGLEKVPVIIRDIDEREAAELALIENLQREDLNPVDEARGYETLMKTFNLSQEEAADRVGKARPTVTNALRLLKLPEASLEALTEKKISAGHARAILSLKSEADMNLLLHEIIEGSLSVRDAESRAKKILEGPAQIEEKPFSIEAEYLSSVEKKASEYLSRRVKIKPRADGKKGGKLTLSWSSSKDLEELLELLCGESFVDNLDR
jgi:ParB family chromosome partitioning protein